MCIRDSPSTDHPIAFGLGLGLAFGWSALGTTAKTPVKDLLSRCNRASIEVTYYTANSTTHYVSAYGNRSVQYMEFYRCTRYLVPGILCLTHDRVRKCPPEGGWGEARRL